MVSRKIFVFFIQKVQWPGSENVNNIPWSGARLVRPIRPSARLAGVSAISAKILVPIQGLKIRTSNRMNGHRLLERECRRHGLPVAQTLKSERLLTKVKENGYETIDEMTRMVGYGRLSAAQMINLLEPPSQTSTKESVTESSVSPRKTSKTKGERSVKVHA